MLEETRSQRDWIEHGLAFQLEHRGREKHQPDPACWFRFRGKPFQGRHLRGNFREPPVEEHRAPSILGQSQMEGRTREIQSMPCHGIDKGGCQGRSRAEQADAKSERITRLKF
ncbi:MAG TPA: hypothetical protein VFK06_14810 [Candidatus Angelobacter sp.]|nr:hypothetical protein [Candidatus Angelobacter sp.]